MLNQTEISQLQPRVRVMQILAGALMMGVVMAAGLLCIVVDWETVNTKLSLMAVVGLVFFVVALVMSFIVPGMVVNATPENDTSTKDMKDKTVRTSHFCALYQTKMIIRLALIEGACFANLVFFLLEGSLISLACAGFGVLIMAFFFPTTDRVVSFIDESA